MALRLASLYSLISSRSSPESKAPYLPAPPLPRFFSFSESVVASFLNKLELKLDSSSLTAAAGLLGLDLAAERIRRFLGVGLLLLLINGVSIMLDTFDPVACYVLIGTITDWFSRGKILRFGLLF